MKKWLYLLPVILIVFVVIVLNIFVLDNQEKRIEKVVQERGGEVIEIEHKPFSNGPFYYRDKNQNIYKFTYEINGEVETGWARTSVFSDDFVFKEGEKKEKIKH